MIVFATSLFLRMTDDTSLAATEQSDNSSALEDVDSGDTSLGSESLNLAELEQLSQQLANKGPAQSEAQLRYALTGLQIPVSGGKENPVVFILKLNSYCTFFRFLLQVMLEACCLEWALLLAVILRDAMAVVRIVNTASLTETPIEMVGRMREGVSFLELWADTEW